MKHLTDYNERIATVGSDLTERLLCPRKPTVDETICMAGLSSEFNQSPQYKFFK
jgi:hypothetical protein